MSKIKHLFDNTFSSCRIVLPESALKDRRPGRITERGWSIRFLFGRDGRGEYMDYYASHAMLSDTHVRLYENGETIALPALEEFIMCPGDTLEHRRQTELETNERNSRVGQALRQKGF